MKRIKLFFYIFLVALFSNIATSKAQTRKQLEEERKKLKQEILKVNKLLFTEQKKEKNALDALDDLNKKIGTRADYIKSINNEAAVLSSEIKQNAKMLLQIHDELIFECQKKDEVSVKKIIKDAMVSVSSSDHHMFSIPLEVSINSGNNWGEAH